jgi:hypothetical protein
VVYCTTRRRGAMKYTVTKKKLNIAFGMIIIRGDTASTTGYEKGTLWIEREFEKEEKKLAACQRITTPCCEIPIAP